ncbi:rCG44811 [Rattus norvegicus]|uniref:RCG44811 n=1 Tax=Rattus norvegicus TaxID=10116 RepID=A6I5W5_RAT|nr:rCG44811 [Rattus norvegicus]
MSHWMDWLPTNVLFPNNTAHSLHTPEDIQNQTVAIFPWNTNHAWLMVVKKV